MNRHDTTVPGYHSPTIKKSNPLPRKQREGYKERFESRRLQKSPAEKAIPRKPGPAKRPPKTGTKDWLEMMAG
jgi:hypothetical protein